MYADHRQRSAGQLYGERMRSAGGWHGGGKCEQHDPGGVFELHAYDELHGIDDGLYSGMRQLWALHADDSSHHGNSIECDAAFGTAAGGGGDSGGNAKG